MDRILELPKEILQRILYFLSQKEAVRTSVLSKSWRNIWCTRPNLDFLEAAFKGNKQEFLPTVDKTLQLYCDQRLCSEEFRLCISLLGKDYSDQELVSLLDKWIPRFTTIGVKEFRLSILSKTWRVDLSSVVFKAESLKNLCLKKCELWRNTPENIPFERLHVLRLHNVLIKEEIFDKMISSCPLLTTMFLRDCKGLKTIKLEKKLHKRLKHFTFINDDTCIRDECSIEIDNIPTLETIKIDGSKIRFHGPYKFSNLHSLSLKWVKTSSESIVQSQLLCIDAPKIKYFEYKGKFIPSISFTTTLEDRRRSNIELYIRGVEDGKSWFVKLSKLLRSLSPSEISLDIVQYYGNIMHIQEDILVQGTTNGGNKPVVVEHLRLNFVDVSSFPSFLNGLFRICRSRNITQSWSTGGDLKKQWEQRELIEYCCKMREAGNYPETMQDLVDLRIEGFDTSRKQWQPLQRTRLLERRLLSISSIRIRLKWSEVCGSSSKILES